MLSFFSLVLILFLLLHGGGSVEQDPRECTQRDSGSNQVMYFLQTAYPSSNLPNAQTMSYCTSFDNDLFGPACIFNRPFMISMQSDLRNIIMNMDLAVLKEQNHRDHEIDMHHLGTPISYWTYRSPITSVIPYIEFHLFRSKVKQDEIKGDNVCGFYHHGCRLRNDGKLCGSSDTCFLPHSDRHGLDYLNMALYVNEYHASRAYFFVKNGSNVWVYPIEFSKLLEGPDVYTNYHEPEFEFAEIDQFHVIRNFPTQNYQNNFFAFDPHFGCFALLFWEGNRSKAPEVHYYYFDEEHPEAEVQLVDKIVLHGFDFYDIFDASKGYLENIMTFPVFKSFGRQVFIGLRKLSGSEEGQEHQKQHGDDEEIQRYRIWTANPNKGRSSDNARIPSRESRNSELDAERRTFLIDGRFIQTEKAKLPRPPKSSSKKAKTTSTTTAAMPRSSPATSSSSSFVPGITSTSYAPVTTPFVASTTGETSSTTVLSTTSTEKEVENPDEYEDGNEAYGKDGQNGDGAKGGFWCGPIHKSWWGLTLFLILDLVFAIIIVLLIIFVLVGRHKKQIYGKQKKSLKKGAGRKKPASKKETTSGKVTAEMEGEKDSGEPAGKNPESVETKKESKKDGKKKEGASKKTKKRSTKEKKMHKK